MKKFKKVVEWEGQMYIFLMIASLFLFALGIGVWYVNELILLQIIVFSVCGSFSFLGITISFCGLEHIKRNVYWVEKRDK